MPQTDELHSFITVKFGENEEAIFNPWCPTFILTDAIRKKCNCDRSTTLDLVDLQGELLNLRSKTREYANTYTADRETYILVKVEKNQELAATKYTSLLNDLHDHYPDVTEKLNNYGSRPNTHSARSSMVSRRTSKWNNMKGKLNGSSSKSPRKGRVSAEPQ